MKIIREDVLKLNQLGAEKMSISLRYLGKRRHRLKSGLCKSTEIWQIISVNGSRLCECHAGNDTPKLSPVHDERYSDYERSNSKLQTQIHL